MRVKIQPGGKVVLTILGLLIIYFILSSSGLLTGFFHIFSKKTVSTEEPIQIETNQSLKRPMNIGWSVNNFSPGIFLANGGGTTTENSIIGKKSETRIKIKEFKDETKLVESFVKGETEAPLDLIVLTFDQLISNYSKLRPAAPVAFLMTEKNVNKSLLFAKNYIRSIKQLVDKRVAVVKNSVSHFFLLDLLKKENLDKNKIKFTFINSEKDVFIKLDSKQAAAFVITDLEVAYLASKNKNLLNLTPPPSEPVSNVQIVIAKDSLAKKYPITLKNFARGVLIANDSISKKSDLLQIIFYKYNNKLSDFEVKNISSKFYPANYEDNYSFFELASSSHAPFLNSISDQCKSAWDNPEISKSIPPSNQLKNSEIIKSLYEEFKNAPPPNMTQANIQQHETIVQKDTEQKNNTPIVLEVKEFPQKEKNQEIAQSSPSQNKQINVKSTKKRIVPVKTKHSKSSVKKTKSSKTYSIKKNRKKHPVETTEAPYTINTTDKNKITIFFAPNSYRLRAEAKSILDELAKRLSGIPNFQVDIVGNTDSTGQDKYNFMLSEWRAKAAAKYLIKNHKIPSDHLKIDGKGSKFPITSNKKEKTRKYNRRVDVNIKTNG